MSRPAGTELSYDVHGLHLAVVSDDPAVLGALELRLRGFSVAPTGSPGIRLEYVSGAEEASPPTGGRPVYETPHGRLDYVAEHDTLHGRFGGVRLRCAATAGVAQLNASAFTGRDLYLATHPLATISLMELLKRRARYPLHAACLATAGGDGVLIAAPSGSGKSTLAFALARAGLDFLGDDTVFLDHGAPTGAVSVLGFADALGVTSHTATSFGELRCDAVGPPPGFPKRLLRLEDVLAVHTVASCTPRLLVVPEIVHDRPSRLSELDPKEALLRLVPDVLLTDPTSTQAHLTALAALLAQVRCHRLESGPDLEHNARLITALL